MAKPPKYATPICIVLSVLALIGIVWGMIAGNPLIPMILLIPTVIYEVYRTEGVSTTLSSWLLLVLFVANFIIIIFDIQFDLGSFLGTSSKYFYGYNVPLGDLRIVFPSVIGVLSIVLFTRTRGIYTRWLSVIIFITVIAIIHITDPEIFQSILKLGVNEAIDRVNI
ncbi:MAG: hypothetical protein ABIC57_00405 [bacterium]